MASMMTKMMAKTTDELIEKLKKPHRAYDVDIAVQNVLLLRILGNPEVKEVEAELDKAADTVEPVEVKRRGRPRKEDVAENV